MKKCTYSFKAVAMLLLLCLIGQAILLGQATNTQLQHLHRLQSQLITLTNHLH